MERVAKVTAWVAIGVAVYFVLAFAVSVALRIGYPYELEWMEGAMLRIVARSAGGEALYVEPTLDFTMSVYAPLYFWIAGLLSSGEVGFTPARLVSVAAVAITLALIWRFVRRTGGSRAAALVGVGFYCATFGIGDAYHDTVHVDSLFVMWLLASCYALRFWNGQLGALASGGLLALAFATKQSALIAPGLMFAACWWARDLRQALTLLLAAVVPAVVWLWTLHAMSDGWSSYFLLGQLADHEVEQQMWRGFWTFDIGKGVPFAFLAATVFMLGLLRKRDWLAAPPLGVAAVVLVGISYGSRLHRGGAENVLFPMYAVLAVLGALGLDRVLRAERPMLRIGAALLCVAQFAMLIYNPARFVPNADDELNGDRLVAAVRQLDGDVLLSFHGQVAAFAGIPPCAHPVTINDVLRAGDAVSEVYRAGLLEILSSHDYDVILMEDTVTDPWWRQTLGEYYRSDGPIQDENRYRWVNAKNSPPILRWVPK